MSTREKLFLWCSVFTWSYVLLHDQYFLQSGTHLVWSFVIGFSNKALTSTGCKRCFTETTFLQPSSLGLNTGGHTQVQLWTRLKQENSFCLLQKFMVQKTKNIQWALTPVNDREWLDCSGYCNWIRNGSVSPCRMKKWWCSESKLRFYPELASCINNQWETMLFRWMVGHFFLTPLLAIAPLSKHQKTQVTHDTRHLV